SQTFNDEVAVRRVDAHARVAHGQIIDHEQLVGAAGIFAAHAVNDALVVPLAACRGLFHIDVGVADDGAAHHDVAAAGRRRVDYAAHFADACKVGAPRILPGDAGRAE